VAVFPVYASMQLGILQMSSNSSAFRSHSSEIDCYIYIYIYIYIHIYRIQYLPNAFFGLTMLCTVFFQTREKYPRDTDDFPVARYLKHVLFFRRPEM